MMSKIGEEWQDDTWMEFSLIKVESWRLQVKNSLERHAVTKVLS